MKTLLFFRHGKSDWSGDQEDHLRPLAPRGRKAAKRMGAFIAASGVCPDLVITSSAVRAVETLEIARKSGKWDVRVEVADALYGAAPADVLDLARQAPDDAETVMLIGHEPTFSETVAALIGGGRIRIPTGAVARIDLDISGWDAASEGDGTLAWLVVPRLVG